MGGRQASNDEHVSAHEEGSPKERATTTYLLDEEKEEEQAGDDFDHAKKAAD